MSSRIAEVTHDILYKNMRIGEAPYDTMPVICLYDSHSEISRMIADGYQQALQDRSGAECIDIDTVSVDEIKQTLMSLPEHSTVVLVQSTNFRLDDFRIRLNLKNHGVGCIEHNHLSYFPEDQISNYIDALSYDTPYYETLSDAMQARFAPGQVLQVYTRDGNMLEVQGGFEEMKRNTGDYSKNSRGGTFPIGENFTEARDLSRVNGSLSIYAYPDEQFQVQFCEPFRIDINESRITCDDPKCPDAFAGLLDKIAASEDGEVVMRELGFGMNRGISWEKRLSDVGAFERVTGFHISLGKKHNIYRKKFDKSVTQRYHIDIFPDVEKMVVDGEVIFEKGEYIIEKE